MTALCSWSQTGLKSQPTKANYGRSKIEKWRHSAEMGTASSVLGHFLPFLPFIYNLKNGWPPFSVRLSERCPFFVVTSLKAIRSSFAVGLLFPQGKHMIFCLCNIYFLTASWTIGYNVRTWIYFSFEYMRTLWHTNVAGRITQFLWNSSIFQLEWWHMPGPLFTIRMFILGE